MVVDQGFAGRTVDLPVGQVLELRLAENPTTGFRWTFIAQGEPVCVVLGSAYQAPSGPPGRAGDHVWEIKGIQPGECELKLSYARPWEKVPAADSFTVHVHVIG